MTKPVAVARGRVLIVAGSDSGGGAGLQADVKTIGALGGYAMTAVTAVTVQNTLGVQDVHVVPASIVRAQIVSVMEDLGADCIKIGMLGTAATIEIVAEALDRCAPGVPVVLDPVMIAKSGHALLDASAVEALRTLLLPRATVLTPNLPEAEALFGFSIASTEAMEAAIPVLRAAAQAVFLKGGHLKGDRLLDLLIEKNGVERFEDARLHSRHTHGTGCTTASAIAAGLAQGLSLGDSARRARAFVRRALETAPGFGKGHGPLNHAHTLDPARIAPPEPSLP